ASYVALRTAKVRAEPSAAAKELGTLAPETVVWVTGRVRDRDWLRIGYNNTSGYVSAALLQEIDAGEVTAGKKAKSGRSPGELEQFLQQSPKGFYSLRAEEMLAALHPAAPRTRAVTPAVGVHPLPTAGSVFKDCADCPELTALAG